MNVPTNSPEDLAAKQKAHLKRARKGILKFLGENGPLPLSQLHDFSLNRYLIQHQGFSQLMESMVEEKLLEYDFAKDAAVITEAGRTFSQAA